MFKVYDVDFNGKVSFNDILEVLQDLSGPFMSDDQRKVLKTAVFTIALGRFYKFCPFIPFAASLEPTSGGSRLHKGIPFNPGGFH